jgi:hypothetical protein
LALSEPFVVFSLPRSRSAWLSMFLSCRGRLIGHDIGADCESPAEFFLKLGAGTCETGAAFAWQFIRRAKPNAKFIVVRRDPFEVADSLARFGLNGFLSEMQARDDDLMSISEQRGVLTVDYHDLVKPEVCAEVFEFCLDEAMPAWWWQRLDALNIQVDMNKQVAKLIRNADRISRLKADVRRRA